MRNESKKMRNEVLGKLLVPGSVHIFHHVLYNSKLTKNSFYPLLDDWNCGSIRIPNQSFKSTSLASEERSPGKIPEVPVVAPTLPTVRSKQPVGIDIGWN